MPEKTEQIFAAFFVVFVNVRSFDLLKTPTFCKISCNFTIPHCQSGQKRRAGGVFPSGSFRFLFRLFFSREPCVAVQQHRELLPRQKAAVLLVARLVARDQPRLLRPGARLRAPIGGVTLRK